MSTKRRLRIHPLGCVCWMTVAYLGLAGARGFATTEQEFLQLTSRQCFDCHSGEAPEASLALDALVKQRPWVQHRETWQRVWQLVDMQVMPPAEAHDWSAGERELFLDYIRNRLDEFDYSKLDNPGHEPIRRLTHREYHYTLRDLLGVNLDIVSRFPRELIGTTGFDNDAATLAMMPALMDRYVSTAERAVELYAARRWHSDQEFTDVTARRALRKFVARAYRRRLGESDLALPLATYHESRQQHQPKKALIQAMQATLVSPAFLLRIDNAPGDAHQVSDFELASRLSYFLWSSMPDSELLRSADRGELRDSRTLSQQVHRMLRDKKASRFADAFVGQWLSTELIGNEIRLDPIDQPWCTDSLMQAMRQEPSRMFLELLHESRPALELITADYTFATTELADALYGLHPSSGEGVLRFSLQDTERRGLLGQAAVLAVTAGYDETVITKRGAFVLDRLLGTPPPPPPPDAGTLDDDLLENEKLSSLEKLGRHAREQRCAGCHQRIDPLGVALEGFGPFGRRRSRDEEGRRVSTRATLPDGTRLSGVGDLRDYIIHARRDDFVRNLVCRTLEYALCRQLEYFDEPAVRDVIADFEQKGLKLDALIHAVVASYPFQYNRPAERQMP